MRHASTSFLLWGNLSRRLEGPEEQCHNCEKNDAKGGTTTNRADRPVFSCLTNNPLVDSSAQSTLSVVGCLELQHPNHKHIAPATICSLTAPSGCVAENVTTALKVRLRDASGQDTLDARPVLSSEIVHCSTHPPLRPFTAHIGEGDS
jgi:hypothetical protein